MIDSFSIKAYGIQEVARLRVRLDLLCEEALER